MSSISAKTPTACPCCSPPIYYRTFGSGYITVSGMSPFARSGDSDERKYRTMTPSGTWVNKYYRVRLTGDGSYEWYQNTVTKYGYQVPDSWFQGYVTKNSDYVYQVVGRVAASTVVTSATRMTVTGRPFSSYNTSSPSAWRNAGSYVLYPTELSQYDTFSWNLATTEGGYSISLSDLDTISNAYARYDAANSWGGRIAYDSGAESVVHSSWIETADSNGYVYVAYKFRVAIEIDVEGDPGAVKTVTVRWGRRTSPTSYCTDAACPYELYSTVEYTVTLDSSGYAAFSAEMPIEQGYDTCYLSHTIA